MTAEQWIALGWQLAGYALAATITLGLPPLSDQGIKLLRAHVADKQWAAVGNVAADTVKAANQYLVTADGRAKKAWVLGIVQEWMDKHHIQLSAAAIDAQIESAVSSENLWNRETPALPADPAPKP